MAAPAGSNSVGRAPGADAVRVSAEGAELKPGGSGEATVRLRIAEGFHVNANPPSDKFLIATAVEASPAEGITPGAPAYPPGVTKKYAFSDKPLNVYDGEVSIRLPLSADAGAAKGGRTLRASVTVQPCSDTECFPPRTIEVTIPVAVN